MRTEATELTAGARPASCSSSGAPSVSVVDRGLAENDPRAHVKSAKGPDGRPCLPLRYRAGATVSRQVAMFNGSLRKRTLECQWEARWDAPTGERFRRPERPIEIEPGFHATCPVEFALPETIERPRSLHLVLESVADGMTVFHDDSTSFKSCQLKR